MNINLHIERLVLNGLDIGPGREGRVKASFEAELMRLLSERGLAAALRSGAALTEVRTDPIKVRNPVKPSEVGREIARSVYGSLGRKGDD
jgi:hypothetical protein